MSNNVIELNDGNFDECLSGDQPILIDFWAEWCGPCKMLTPTIEELSNDFSGKAVIAKVNVDESPTIAQQYSIRSIPSIIFFKNGSPAKQLVGVVAKEEMAKIIEELL